MPSSSVLWPFAACLAVALALGTAPSATAQADAPSDSLTAGRSGAPETAPTVDFSGLVYMDYAVTAASPEADDVGANSFDYRRLYVTADYTLSDAFTGRVRMEASGSSTTAQGRPAPFLKDVWIRWDGPLAEGHRLTLGVQPPPLFDVSESVWGYRSLEKTLLDRVRANDSRDFGLRADGPLAPAAGLAYAVMVANGRGVNPENGGARGKHVYAQLRARPTQAARASVGLDYTAHEGESEGRDTSLKASVFAGALTDTFQGGVEAFAVRTQYVDTARETESGIGVSAFGAASFGARGEYRAIGRVDVVEADARGAAEPETFVLVAAAYAPIPAVEIMPNVLISKERNQDAEVIARLTVHARF